MKCRICGAYIEEEQFINDAELAARQLCFNCNFWLEQLQADKYDPDRQDHHSAIVDGVHYVLCPHTDSPFKGFGGHKVTFKFFDGVERECDNTWCQGNVKDAHPHWRALMPDNATIQW